MKYLDMNATYKLDNSLKYMIITDILYTIKTTLFRQVNNKDALF